jgi:putative nucleotidyltransferase with HDIG domain
LHWLAGATFVGGCFPLSDRAASSDLGELVLLQPWQPTQAFLDDVRTALGAVLGLAFALALAGGVVFSHRMTGPLREIVTAAEEIAAGDWDRQAPQEGRTEIAVMAAAFNHMTASLRHWYQEAQAHSERLGETLVQLQHAHRATLEALSRALDARDNETEGHSLRVAHYAMRLAEEMNLDEEALSSLRWGALLHDVGKIGVSDTILHKPARLTPAEMQEMQRHCEFGLEIVRGIPYLERAADVIGCHHERYDGGGYPRGLSGGAIPLGARIFSVADTLDAITSDRPYRSASSFGDALREIEQHTGTQFDPDVVAALRALIQELQEWRQEIQPREAALVRAIGQL